MHPNTELRRATKRRRLRRIVRPRLCTQHLSNSVAPTTHWPVWRDRLTLKCVPQARRLTPARLAGTGPRRPTTSPLAPDTVTDFNRRYPGGSSQLAFGRNAARSRVGRTWAAAARVVFGNSAPKTILVTGDPRSSDSTAAEIRPSSALTRDSHPDTNKAAATSCRNLPMRPNT